MGCSKSSSKGEVHTDKRPPQERRKISTLYHKELEKKITIRTQSYRRKQQRSEQKQKLKKQKRSMKLRSYSFKQDKKYTDL